MVTGDDWQIPELQRAYAGHWPRASNDAPRSGTPERHDPAE
jgi:hypothetical protein